MTRARGFKRVVLETALKPFRELAETAIRDVCAELFRQWEPLIRCADRSAVLLWTADGSEILTYGGRLDEEFEWARYIGFANTQYPHAYEKPGARDYRKAVPYIENPPRMTYGWLKAIVAALREVGFEVTGKPVSVGATFDPGPEFAHSPFRYELHPEVFSTSPAGRRAIFLCAYSELNADSESYAGFPDGIPQGTSFGRFLGRQTQRFLSDMGFDYVWFSNGFGFSHFGSSGLGEAFDGQQFSPEHARAFARKTLGFWNDFREECPDFPVETRGTNLSTGMDLSRDGVPLDGIYRGGFNIAPPPNSPWGALDGDYALEMVGFMSRIASLPGDDFPFRFYIHDSWYPIRPWWDAYGREPLDIYCPLSVGRINGDGEVEHPSSVEFLAANTCEGLYLERSALEVIPHILTAVDHFPDAPGVVTWVYPFTEYHDMTHGERNRMDEVYFGDWYVRDAINNGFPANTVVSSENFAASYAKDPTTYSETVLFAPVPGSGSVIVDPLCDFISKGGKALLYGPTRYADERIRQALNLGMADELSGELAVESQVNLDSLGAGGYPTQIHHREVSSAGGIAEVLLDDSDGHTNVCATVCGGEQKRVAALIRSLPEWKGGAVGWVRGTNSFAVGDRPRADDPETWFHGSYLPRFVLARLGYVMSVEKHGASPRSPIWFVTRVRNGFFFTGYTPDTTVRSRFRFPYGAPILVGWQARIEGGFSTYSFGRSYHEECRLFVDQAAETTISCTEYPSRFPWMGRRLRVTGLERATLRFFRESGSPDRPVLMARANGIPTGEEEQIPCELEADGLQLVARDVSGNVMISW